MAAQTIMDAFHVFWGELGQITEDMIPYLDESTCGKNFFEVSITILQYQVFSIHSLCCIAFVVIYRTLPRMRQHHLQ